MEKEKTEKRTLNNPNLKPGNINNNQKLAYKTWGVLYPFCWYVWAFTGIIRAV